MTKEEEIKALQFARKQVQSGVPYICNHLRVYQQRGSTPVDLIAEVMEFLDYKPTVEAWLSHGEWRAESEASQCQPANGQPLPAGHH